MHETGVQHVHATARQVSCAAAAVGALQLRSERMGFQCADLVSSAGVGVWCTDLWLFAGLQGQP